MTLLPDADHGNLLRVQPGESLVLEDAQLDELGRDTVVGQLQPNLLDRRTSVVAEMTARLTDEGDAYGVHDFSLGRGDSWACSTAHAMRLSMRRTSAPLPSFTLM